MNLISNLLAQIPPLWHSSFESCPETVHPLTSLHLAIYKYQIIAGASSDRMLADKVKLLSQQKIDAYKTRFGFVLKHFSAFFNWANPYVGKWISCGELGLELANSVIARAKKLEREKNEAAATEKELAKKLVAVAGEGSKSEEIFYDAISEIPVASDDDVDQYYDALEEPPIEDSKSTVPFDEERFIEELMPENLRVSKPLTPPEEKELDPMLTACRDIWTSKSDQEYISKLWDTLLKGAEGRDWKALVPGKKYLLEIENTPTGIILFKNEIVTIPIKTPFFISLDQEIEVEIAVDNEGKRSFTFPKGGITFNAVPSKSGEFRNRLIEVAKQLPDSSRPKEESKKIIEDLEGAMVTALCGALWWLPTITRPINRITILPNKELEIGMTPYPIPWVISSAIKQFVSDFDLEEIPLDLAFSFDDALDGLSAIEWA